MKRIITALCLSLLLASCCDDRNAGRVTLGTLLGEMTSLEEVARWPATPYTCRLESSRDRASVAPGSPEWFANNDGFGFIRTDTIDSRTEKVLFEEEGPGAITRIWLTTQNPAGTLRFYFDGERQPGWVVPAYDLMQFGLAALGRGLLQPHTSYEPGVKGGSTLFLPIPYARGCRVTLEEPAWMQAVPHYYQFNFRRYPAGTEVETFSIHTVEKYRKQLVETDRLLLSPDRAAGAGRKSNATRRLAPGDTLTLELPAGVRCATRAEFRVGCDSAAYEQTMRGLLFTAAFDGVQTVYAPLSDFSGGGMGAPAVESWFLSSDGKGGVVSRWPMPYREKAVLRVCNLSQAPCEVTLNVQTDACRWDERMLYFHTSWKQESGLAIRKRAEDCYDWNFTTLHGRGVYRGDVLSLFNHARAWYGEGDEKIWIDGERFPSHFGTGVEDYYNSSWAPVYPFHTPFGGAPRADLKNSQGYNTFFRTRNLDGIPFGEKMVFDMEMLSWIDGEVDYATTVFWYGDLGAAAVVTSGAEELRRPLLPRPADPADYTIADALEFEKLLFTRKSPGLNTDRQNMAGFPEGMWSGQTQLVAFGGRAGDYLEFELSDLVPGRYRLGIYATKAADYGCVKFTANGSRPAVFDAYSDFVTQVGPIELRSVEIPDGKLTLRAEITGKNPLSSGTMLGLDCLVLTHEEAEK